MIDAYASGCTTRRRNAHGITEYELLYPWHPWRIVIDQIRSLLQTPEIMVQTWRAARKTDKGLTESEVRVALLEFEPLWNELFPAEQARIVELLVERRPAGSICVCGLK